MFYFEQLVGVEFYITQRTSLNLPDSQFCLKSKTEPKCSKHSIKLGGGEHRTEKVYSGRRGHRTYFLNRVPIGGGTPHIPFGQGANRGGHRTSKQAPSSHWICQKKVSCGQMEGGFIRIMPRCGSILQAGTCQILSLAKNPRWSRVWQKS